MMIQYASYGPWVDDLLQAIPNDVYPPADRKKDIKEGVIFSINDRAAVAVLGLEWGGQDLWCKALAGQVGGKKALLDLLAFLDRMARTCKARTVKIRTIRPGMAKALRQCGYQIADQRGHFEKIIQGAG